MTMIFDSSIMVAFLFNIGKRDYVQGQKLYGVELLWDEGPGL